MVSEKSEELSGKKPVVASSDGENKRAGGKYVPPHLRQQVFFRFFSKC
jgi:hypothetical protein